MLGTPQSLDYQSVKMFKIGQSAGFFVPKLTYIKIPLLRIPYWWIRNDKAERELDAFIKNLNDYRNTERAQRIARLFLNGVEYTQVGGKAELSIFRDDDIV